MRCTGGGHVTVGDYQDIGDYQAIGDYQDIGDFQAIGDYHLQNIERARNQIVVLILPTTLMSKVSIAELDEACVGFFSDLGPFVQSAFFGRDMSD
jgi:hypothetical protein